MQETIRSAGMTPAPTSPEEFDRIMRTDYERWGRIVKQTGVKAE